MKAYLSFWSPGYHQQDAFNHNLYKLSAFYAKKYFKNVHLITDNNGKKYLEDIKFDTIDTSLESLPKDIGLLWSLGKIEAYRLIALKQEPFIHIDNDIFLIKDITPYIKDKPIFAQHKEDVEISGYDMQQFEVKLPVKGLLAKHKIKHAANMGIFGGTDMDFILRYSTETINLALNNENISFYKKSSFRKNWEPTVMHEQYYMSLMADYEKKEVTYLLQDLYNLDPEAIDKGFVHLWGAKKLKKQELFNKIYTILYYLELNPKGKAPWQNGELIDIN